MFMRTMLALACLSFVLSAGCAKVGSTAGKAQAKIERKAHAVEDGYHRGYAEEKAKSGK